MKTIVCGCCAALWLALNVAAQQPAADKVPAQLDFSKLPPLEVGSAEADSPTMALADAQRLFAAGKDAEGAKRLEAACWSKAGTSDYTVEYLAHLSFVAVSLEECGKRNDAERVGRRALAELDKAGHSKELAGDKERQKELLRRAAHVNARVLGDHVAAADRLQEASDLDPDDKDAKKVASEAKESARQFGKRAKGGK